MYAISLSLTPKRSEIMMKNSLHSFICFTIFFIFILVIGSQSKSVQTLGVFEEGLSLSLLHSMQWHLSISCFTCWNNSCSVWVNEWERENIAKGRHLDWHKIVYADLALNFLQAMNRAQLIMSQQCRFLFCKSIF